MNTTFRGEYGHTVDDKGRVIVPAKFRAELGERFVITKGLDGCLFILKEEDWDAKFAKRFENQPMLDASAIKLQRFFTASAVDASVDSQGRVAIVGPLRTWAQISPMSDVVFVGMTTWIELWSKFKWDAYMAKQGDDDILECAKSLGLGGNPLAAAVVPGEPA